jgi:glycosyltransferase involved in cell wall biosynthesis
MNILFVSLFLPQEKAYHAGGRYVFEIIKNMSLRHDIYLATRLEENEIELLENLKPFCKKIYPYTYPSFEKRGITDKIRLGFNYIRFSLYANKLIHQGNFDIVQVEWVEPALMMKRGKVPMLLDAHDVITKPAGRVFKHAFGIKRLLVWFRYIIIKNTELGIAKKFDMILTRSDYDREYLLNLQPTLKVKTVPHPAGLDITDRVFGREKNTMLFLASYKYHRINVAAALYFNKQVMPLIRMVIPDAVFIIAGYGPPEELTSLAQKDSQVLVTGFVDDLDECYKKAAVFVAPILTGGGIIVKILDALAAGTPVVTTSYGNEGIGAVDGRDLLVADDPQSFADAVVKLLTDRGYAERIASTGQAFVKDNYGLASVLDKLESSYRELSGSISTGVRD